MSNKKKNIKDGFFKTQNAMAKLLRFLRIRPPAGGLEITDQLIRLAYFERSVWQFYAVRMEPGIIQGGKILDETAFVAALTALRAQVPRHFQKNGTLNVVVSLGATSIYNQIFDLPLLRGESFDTAMKLNLQMSSSVDIGETYSGWEIVETDESSRRVKALGMFVGRAIVDPLIVALFAAGFVTIAVESRAIALARFIREYGSGLDLAGSYLIVMSDDNGIDFAILRHGRLCFEYMSSWRDMADEKGEIPLERFRQSFSLGMNQVLNFYRQHWKDQIMAVGLSGNVLTEEIRTIVSESQSMKIFLLSDIFDIPFDNAWIVPLGSGLRGMAIEQRGDEIDLLGEGAKKIFEDNMVLNSLSFWRVVVPIAFVAFIAILFSADVFLRTTGQSALQYAASATAENSKTSRDAASLITQANVFNRSVAMISSIEASSTPQSVLIGALSAAASAANVTITEISLPTEGASITVSGQTQSETSISVFKTAVAQIPGISSVNLPLDGIQTSGSSYTFSMTFAWSGVSPDRHF
jgi:hypothetical protein